ncbi:MAG: hypothetical protein ACREHG_00465 [Candidatus Saccharimonadales bacterium]
MTEKLFPRDDEPYVQQYLAHLDRSEKVLDWVYGGLAIGCFLAFIFALAIIIKMIIAGET